MYSTKIKVRVQQRWPSLLAHIVLNRTQCLAWHALARGSRNMPLWKLLKPTLLRLNLEAVLMENYDAVKLIMDG